MKPAQVSARSTFPHQVEAGGELSDDELRFRRRFKSVSWLSLFRVQVCELVVFVWSTSRSGRACCFLWMERREDCIVLLTRGRKVWSAMCNKNLLASLVPMEILDFERFVVWSRKSVAGNLLRVCFWMPS